MTAASGGLVDWQRRPRAFRPIPTRDRGDDPGSRREHPGNLDALLHAPVRRTSRTARRHLQPGQPGREDPADGPRGLGGGLRQLPDQGARATTRAPVVADRAQARVPGHHPGPVRRRPRPPVLGDRRRPRRRGHPRDRRRVGRGLLADGLRPGQPGARPLQRPRRAAGDGLARVGGRREEPGDRRRRHLPDAEDRRPPGQDLAPRPVRDRAGTDARRRPPAPPVQPHPGRRRRAPSVRGQARPGRGQAGRRGLELPVRPRAGR